MEEEIAVENGRISNFEGLVSYCIPSCITHRQISLKSKKHFVDGWTYVHMYVRTYIRTYVRTDRQTFETGFNRSTLKSRPNKASLKCPL